MRFLALLTLSYASFAGAAPACRVRVIDYRFNGKTPTNEFLPKHIKNQAECHKRALGHCAVYNPATVEKREVAFSYADQAKPADWKTTVCAK